MSKAQHTGSARNSQSAVPGSNQTAGNAFNPQEYFFRKLSDSFGGRSFRKNIIKYFLAQSRPFCKQSFAPDYSVHFGNSFVCWALFEI